MKPNLIPDVLFLRPATNDSGSAENSGLENNESATSTAVATATRPVKTSIVTNATKSNQPANPSSTDKPASDVVFNSLPQATPKPVPTPHTTFAPRSTTTGSNSVAHPKSVAAKPRDAAIETAVNPVAQEAIVGQAAISDFPTPPSNDPWLELEAKTKIEPSWLVDQFRWAPVMEQLLQTNAASLAKLIYEIQKPNQSHTVLGVIGLSENIGTTTISQLMARLLDESVQKHEQYSQSTETTLLIDGNLQHPAIGNQIGLRCRKCWADLQESKDSLGDAVISNSENRIHVMPLNCRVQEDALDRSTIQRPHLSSGYTIPANGISSLVGRLNNVIADATQHYKNIIIDLGTVDAWQSRLGLEAISQHLNHVLLVNQSPIDRRQFSQVYWDLTDGGVTNVHLLENPLVKVQVD